MKRVVLLWASMFMMLSPGYASEQATNPQHELSDDQAMTLLKNKICMSCHQVDERRVGPSFKMIADKYKNDTEVTTIIVAKRITDGSANIWGPLRMPAQPKVSEDEALQMADWILKR